METGPHGHLRLDSFSAPPLRPRFRDCLVFLSTHQAFLFIIFFLITKREKCKTYYPLTVLEITALECLLDFALVFAFFRGGGGSLLFIWRLSLSILRPRRVHTQADGRSLRSV